MEGRDEGGFDFHEAREGNGIVTKEWQTFGILSPILRREALILQLLYKIGKSMKTLDAIISVKQVPSTRPSPEEQTQSVNTPLF
jgi:hypothetical protein